MMWWNDRYNMMGNGWSWLLMAGLLVLFILGIVALIRYIQQPGQQSKPMTGNKALEILNERYAKGEINDEEYRAKKSELMK